MDVTPLLQPLTRSPSVRDFLRLMAMDPEIERIQLVVAWAKESGLNLVRRDLESFIARGGELQVITGISQGGATRQGLSGLLAITPNVYVYHQDGRTFHPKIYFGVGDRKSRFVIGSQNLTGGGLLTNFEVGLMCTADLELTEDRLVTKQLTDYFEVLIADKGGCVKLTEETLANLLDDPQYGVGDESNRWAAGTVSKTSDGSDGARASLFARSGLDLSHPRQRALHASSGRQIGLIKNSASVDPKVIRRWFKRLPASNVSRVGGNTNPQGHMTLTRGPGIKGQSWHPIKQGTYFREIFFGDAPWKPGGKPTSEVVDISFAVEVRGANMGMFTLTVEHNTSFESGQGNRTSFLHWGPKLSEYLRKTTDHTGDVATLEKFSDGSYRLVIDDKPTGPFV